MLRCPACDSLMIVLEASDIEVDHCLECGGVWLDEGELELLLESAEGKRKLLASMQTAPESSEKKRKCPRCSKKMEKVLIGTTESITIDRCPAHDGLWFDRGELGHILRMAEVQSEGKVFEILGDIFIDREK